MASTKKDPYRYFKIEANELLDQLNNGMLQLEENPADTPLLDEMFRLAHTLKGSARLVKLTNLGDIAHYIEDILGEAKAGEIQLTSEIIDRFIVGLDAVAAVLKHVNDGTDPHIDVSASLEQMKREASAPAPASEVAPPVAEPDVAGQAATVTPVKIVEKVKSREVSSIHDAPAEDNETVRISIGKLNNMLALSGELVINKIKLQEKSNQLASVSALLEQNGKYTESWLQFSGLPEFEDLKARHSDLKEVFKDIEQSIQTQQKIREEINYFASQYEQDVKLTHSISMDLQEEAFRARLLPANSILMDFKRFVRDIAKELNKEIKLNIIGGEIEVDKHILDEIKAPLMHLVRNAAGHGLEPVDERVANNKNREGSLTLTLMLQGSGLIITCEDDGAGIDLEKIRAAAIKKNMLTSQEAFEISDAELLYFILEPGFSTSEIITNLSGRGVGLDVVATAIAGLRGQVSIKTESGRFTRFIIELPRSLANLPCLLIESGHEKLLLPLSCVVETFRIEKKEIEIKGNREVIRISGRATPLVRLNQILKLPDQALDSKKIPVVGVSSRGEFIAFAVNGLIGVREVVVKNIGNHIKRVANVGATTILGDGNPVVILDPVQLIQNSKEASLNRITDGDEDEGNMDEVLPILVIDDSLTTRMMEKSILESAGYEVDLAVCAEEAMEKVKEKKYELMVVDVEMPGMTGFEFIKKFNDNPEFPETPSIIVSSLASAEMKRKGIDAGAKGYIVKGEFDQNLLLETIESLI